MSDKNPTSTRQSWVDSATGAAQSALGSVTGSGVDKQRGEEKKDVARTKDLISHSGANIGGYSISADGVAQNNPNRKEGSRNQTIGSGKEFVGGALGLDGLKKEGQQQNEQGKAQEAAGQLNDLGSGISDRVQGAVGGAVAGITGDKHAQAEAQAKHDRGKTLQRGVEAEAQKRA